jgi:hypothetical protein
VMRTVARMLLPSTRLATTRACPTMLSRLILTTMLERSMDMSTEIQ